MTDKFNIELSASQLELIDRAVDFYSRIMIGDLDSINMELRMFPVGEYDVDALQEKLYECKDLLGVPRNGNKGIHNKEVSPDAIRLYDIHQVMRNALAYHWQPKGGIQVDFDEPIKWGPDELIKVLKVKEESH